MTRTEEVRKGFKHIESVVPMDAVMAQALGEIAITLAMMYDLMREKESKDEDNR